jgi:alkylation response protein AidB-like acyl-CoA dehydrogenase
VRTSPIPPPGPLDLVAEPDRDIVLAAREAGGDAGAALALAIGLGVRLPAPGAGGTLRRWAALSAAGRGSLTAARVLEAHADALAILGEAGATIQPGLGWGVYAAESPGSQLIARAGADGPRLDGAKPWCSLAGMVDRALVTAHLDGGRGLFEVDMTDPTVEVLPSTGWVARGLSSVTSSGVLFHDTPASAVGAADWYLTRPGFAWGGIGVAACWYGGALGLLDDLVRFAGGRADDLTHLQLGSAQAALHAAGCTLRDAAARIDGGEAAGAAGAALALAVRSVVARAAEDVLRAASHALGPGPVAFDESHAARTADLDLYIRQHHAERDVAALGASIAAALGAQAGPPAGGSERRA